MNLAEGKPAHLEDMSKEHRQEREESNIVGFHAREELVSQPKSFKPCPAFFLSSAEHCFLDALDWTTLDTVITRAGLHERRDCQAHAVLSAAGKRPVIVVLPPDESGRVYEENFSLRRGSHL